MVANFKRCVFGLRELDSHLEFLLKLLNALRRGRPALNFRWLHYDALDLLATLKHPLHFRSTHGSCRIKHQLRIFLGLYCYAVTKLPIQNDSAFPNPTKQISRTKNIAKKIPKAHSALDGNIHLAVRVNLIK